MDTSKNRLIRLFLETCEAKGLRPKTLCFYRERLTCFANTVNLPLEQVDTFTLRRYLLQRQQQGLSAHTVHADYRALRAFFRWCVQEELLDHDPMQRVQAPKTDVVCKPILEPQQVQKLLDACKGNDWLRKRDRALLLVLLDTGLRIGEVHQMTVADGLSETFLMGGKARRDRVVCLTAQTRLAVRKYLNACPYHLTPEQPLWWGAQGALTVHGLQEVVEHIGERAGIHPLGCHVFRRTFAVWSLRNGMSLEHLRELLGHRDFAMLKHYVQLAERDLKQAHEQYSPLRMLKTQHTRGSR